MNVAPDWAKVENNQLKINYTQNDVVGYIRYITESFHSAANVRNVMLKVSARPPEIMMDYDPEKIQQILSIGAAVSKPTSKITRLSIVLLIHLGRSP